MPCVVRGRDVAAELGVGGGVQRPGAAKEAEKAVPVWKGLQRVQDLQRQSSMACGTDTLAVDWVAMAMTKVEVDLHGCVCAVECCALTVTVCSVTVCSGMRVAVLCSIAWCLCHTSSVMGHVTYTHTGPARATWPARRTDASTDSCATTEAASWLCILNVSV